MKGRYSAAPEKPTAVNPFEEEAAAAVAPISEDGGEDGNNNNKKKGRKKNPFGAIKKRLGRGHSGSEDDVMREEDLILDGVDSELATGPPTTNSTPPPIPENTAFRSAIVLTQAGADIGMAAAEAEAEANGWDVTICICDASGVPIQVKRNTSIGAASYDLAVNKAKSAALHGKTTGTAIHSELDALTTVYPYQQIRGGVPLILNAVCCGAVGVSGRLKPEHQEQVAEAGTKAMFDNYWSFQVMAGSMENNDAASPPV